MFANLLNEYVSVGNMGIQQQSSPISPQSAYSQNGMASPQKSISPNNYDSQYTTQVPRASLQPSSPVLSPHSNSLHSPGNTIVANYSNASANSVTNNSVSETNATNTINGISTINRRTTTLVQISQQAQRHNTHIKRECSTSPILTTIKSTTAAATATAITNNSSTSCNNTTNNNNNSVSITTDIEEINTKELAQRISAELKRYSIPQAIFAQRVLCRSQGTLSDLLRNPKPWSKLKSGRETFRRMWKWLQEPEIQRMSALRLAGKLFRKF